MRVVIRKDDFVPVVKHNNRYSIYFDVLPAQSFQEGEGLISCEVKDVPLTLTEEGIKGIVIKSIKERYSKEIRKGFAYDENHYITLSDYEQTNFCRLYSMSGLLIYPFTMDIGNSEEFNTITFEDKTEFDAFMMSVSNFIEGKRSECRQVLSDIDWTIYRLPQE